MRKFEKHHMILRPTNLIPQIDKLGQVSSLDNVQFMQSVPSHLSELNFPN